MAPKVTRLLIGERQLFSVVEKQNGELTLPINAGAYFVINGVEKSVREHRYSIHSSSRSQNYTTIKQTVELETNEKFTSVSLTDAVKNKNGFSIIYVRRCQDLTDPSLPMNFSQKGTDTVYALPAYDPKMFTMFHALFVGHPDTEFSIPDENIIISPFRFRDFQLLVFISLEPFPSVEFSEFLHAITSPPEANQTDLGQALLRHLMTGRSPENCIKQYRNSVHLLTKRFFQRMLPLLKDPKIIERVKADIAAIPDVTLNELELDTGQRLIDMLSDPMPPNRG